MKKKYLVAGSALVLSLSLCIYALNQHQVEGNRDNNRVSYVDGKQDSQKTDQALLATPTNEKVGKELPNTGVTRDASLVALGLLGVMSGYGLLAGKKRENESI